MQETIYVKCPSDKSGVVRELSAETHGSKDKDGSWVLAAKFQKQGMVQVANPAAKSKPAAKPTPKK